MDSQFTPSREELYHVQMDVKHVQAVQINHADRLLRLEKRQADDAALKSVWGTGSPFPGILSGTPQQGPIQNPSTDVFDDFDDEQGQNILGSLQLEADEEPVRRGASRANSVRFDISAIQGSNWAQSSSNSGEFGPVRPSSGFGSHPMMERSLSHKSDGRHSSAGHSVHSMHSVPSGRTSSLGLDTNFIIGDQDDDSLDIPDPPPGLFVLGSVPSIIRCWLTTNFSHSALLYADICSGSQRSVLDFSLVKELALLDQIQKDSTGRHTVRLPIYLPEAIITHPSSRSNSPAPQLPTLTVDFEIVGLAQRNNSDRKKSIRVFVGSDTLRSHNADVLFSQNLMTLYGDDRNKLSIPFVRPEDEVTFKNLCTANIPPEKNELKATAASFTPTESKPKVEVAHDTLSSALLNKIQPLNPSQQDPLSASTVEPRSPFTPISTSESSAPDQAPNVKSENSAPPSNLSDSEKSHRTESAATEPEPRGSSDSNRRESAPGIWGSWRQGSINGTDNSKDNETTSGYQRATRGGRSMKVLKSSSKSIPSASAPTRSISRTRTPYEPPASGQIRRKSQVENVPLRWESKRVGSEHIPKVPRSENPVGGASAFAWMNPVSSKKTSTTAE